MNQNLLIISWNKKTKQVNKTTVSEWMSKYGFHVPLDTRHVISEMAKVRWWKNAGKYR